MSSSNINSTAHAHDTQTLSFYISIETETLASLGNSSTVVAYIWYLNTRGYGRRTWPTHMANFSEHPLGLTFDRLKPKPIRTTRLDVDALRTLLRLLQHFFGHLRRPFSALPVLSWSNQVTVPIATACTCTSTIPVSNSTAKQSILLSR
jgi:hypothetical protein